MSLYCYHEVFQKVWYFFLKFFHGFIRFKLTQLRGGAIFLVLAHAFPLLHLSYWGAGME